MVTNDDCVGATGPTYVFNTIWASGFRSCMDRGPTRLPSLNKHSLCIWVVERGRERERETERARRQRTPCSCANNRLPRRLKRFPVLSLVKACAFFEDWIGSCHCGTHGGQFSFRPILVRKEGTHQCFPREDRK